MRGQRPARVTPVLHRLWLAPDRNDLPVRIDRLHDLDLAELRGVPYVIERQSDFREVDPGLWFPFRSRRYQVFSDKAPLVIETRVESVAFNGCAAVPDRVEVPAGTHVSDAVLGLTYQRGAPSEAAARLIAAASRREVWVSVLAVGLAALALRGSRRISRRRPKSPAAEARVTPPGDNIVAGTARVLRFRRVRFVRRREGAATGVDPTPDTRARHPISPITCRAPPAEGVPKARGEARHLTSNRRMTRDPLTAPPRSLFCIAW